MFTGIIQAVGEVAARRSMVQYERGTCTGWHGSRFSLRGVYAGFPGVGPVDVLQGRFGGVAKEGLQERVVRCAAGPERAFRGLHGVLWQDEWGAIREEWRPGRIWWHRTGK